MVTTDISSSDMRQAEAEIRAWTTPNTPLDEMTAGLLDAYSTRSEGEKLAFVGALIGRIMVSEARKRVSK
jgi:hypothetical protein